jgi:hypothetical protein
MWEHLSEPIEGTVKIYFCMYEKEEIANSR